MANEPDRLSINKDDRLVYDEIYESSELKGKSNKEVFLLAMIIGFKKRQRVPIKKREGFILMTYLNDEDKALMNAIATFEKKDEEILHDQREVFNIVEEYANAGIKLLRELVFDRQSGSFIKKFESYLRDSLSSK